jgi:hypothetical protein
MKSGKRGRRAAKARRRRRRIEHLERRDLLATDFSGIISSNTVWNSGINLTGDVFVRTTDDPDRSARRFVVGNKLIIAPLFEAPSEVDFPFVVRPHHDVVAVLDRLADVSKRRAVAIR